MAADHAEDSRAGTLRSVFVLQHVAREDAPDENVKLIGVYSSRSAALAAVERLQSRPGFRKYPHGFHVDEFTMDKDSWSEGFGFD